MNNVIDEIIAYECGELDESQTLQLFARLIKSHMAWSLQGHYGRVASSLIDRGYISEDGEQIFYQETEQ